MENKLVPELRFGEFGGEWKETTLGSYFEFKNGINADKEQYGSGIKFINVSDILENDYLTYERIKGSVNVPEEQIVKNEVKYGDVLFQRSSETREEVGTANIYLDKENRAVFGGFVIRGRAIKEYSPQFMNYLLKTSSVRKDITSRSGGSTRYNIGQDSLTNSSFTLPTLPEQQKIATFLTAVDGRLAGLRRQRDLLVVYKRGVMQRVFSGEVRFRDEEGENYPDWKTTTLGKIASFTKGKGISKSQIDPDGKNKCIRYGELYTEYSEVIETAISRTSVSKSGSVVSKGNEVLIPSSGETRIDIATAACVLEPGVILGGDINIMSVKANGVFMAYYLTNFKKYAIAKLGQGNSVVHLYSSQLKTVSISLPSLPEQTRIATHLRALDDRIALVERQLAGAETFKRGLLQGMFV